MMAAQFVGAPLLAIDKDEAKKLGAAILAVQDFYNVKTSAEVLLWTQVGGALIAVYGPRIGAAFINRKKEPKKSKDNVTNINKNKPADNGFFYDVPPAN